MGTKQKPMKVSACENKEKIKVVDKQGIHLNRGFFSPVLHKRIKFLNVENVPLKEEDNESWLDFKKIDEGKPVITRIDMMELMSGKMHRPIKADHPFVSVICDIAIAAYNEVVFVYKKSNIMSHCEVMDCRYLNMGKYHYFYMIIEAIEEGVLGRYSIIVACDLIHGNTTLVRKRLNTNSTPTGKMAMMLPHLNSLKSEYKTFNAMKKHIEIKLERARKAMKLILIHRNKHLSCQMLTHSNDYQKVAAKLKYLKKKHKAIKGKCDLLYREIESQIPKGWSKTRDTVRHTRYYRGLIQRKHAYDYYVQSTEFPLYRRIM